MLKEFKLESTALSILGYHWDVDRPLCSICLIHGIGEHAGRYGRMAAMFNAAGISVFAMDLRGHGCSSGKRGHCSPRIDVLSDIDSLLSYADSKLLGKPRILFGHSMGGNIALDYRYRGKLSEELFAYVISSPWINLSRKLPRLMYLATKAVSLVKPDFLVSSGINPAYLGNPEMIRAEKRSLLHRRISIGTVADCVGIGRKIESGALSQKACGLQKPMLLMHGSDDKICDVNSTRRFAAMEGPSCTYIEWEGYLHELHNGNNEKDGTEVIGAVIEWIRGLLLSE